MAPSTPIGAPRPPRPKKRWGYVDLAPLAFTDEEYADLYRDACRELARVQGALHKAHAIAVAPEGGPCCPRCSAIVDVLDECEAGR